MCRAVTQCDCEGEQESQHRSHCTGDRVTVTQTGANMAGLDDDITVHMLPDEEDKGKLSCHWPVGLTACNNCAE